MKTTNGEGRPHPRAALRNNLNDATSVQRGADNVTYPTAFAALYAPDRRRTRWWASYTCPLCAAVHFARLNSENDTPSIRRTGCGHLIRLIEAVNAR